MKMMMIRAPEMPSTRSLAGASLAAILLSATGWALAAPVVPVPPEGKNVLSRTTLTSDVMQSPGKETVVLTEYLTGRSDEAGGIGVMLTVYENRPDGRVPAWGRDYLKEWGGPIAGSELSLIDLDADGRNEIMVSMHQGESAGNVNIQAEILWEAGGVFVKAWSGPIEVDTSGPDFPTDSRERYTREIDFDRTSRTRGGMIFFNKKISLTAGVPIDPPSVISESFPLRARPSAAVHPESGDGSRRAAGESGGR